MLENSDQYDAEAKPTFVLVGNRLGLDFANSVHAKKRDLDMLRVPKDIPAFLAAAGEIDEAELERLNGLLLASPDKAGNLLTQALQFRKILREWLGGLSDRKSADPALAASLQLLFAAMPHADSLKATSDGKWRRCVESLGDPLLWMLRPIILSVAELLAEDGHLPIRKCGNPRCPIYFYDISRTGKRRWCSMESCGNRAKVRAFLDRQAS
jgi:predicted RNA-binding Zn ribbon-like protein